MTIYRGYLVYILLQPRFDLTNHTESFIVLTFDGYTFCNTFFFCWFFEYFFRWFLSCVYVIVCIVYGTAHGLYLILYHQANRIITININRKFRKKKKINVRLNVWMNEWMNWKRNWMFRMMMMMIMMRRGWWRQQHKRSDRARCGSLHYAKFWNFFCCNCEIEPMRNEMMRRFFFYI